MSFPKASEELSDVQIHNQYGSLLEGAISAFGEDPYYLIDMAEHGALIVHKRELWQERRRKKAAAV